MSRRESVSNRRPDPLAGLILPPLHVGIYKDGELQSVAEMPDPRKGFCKHFDFYTAFGLYAIPLTEAEAKRAAKALKARRSLKVAG